MAVLDSEEFVRSLATSPAALIFDWRLLLISALTAGVLADADRRLVDEALARSDRDARALSADASLERGAAALAGIYNDQPAVAAALRRVQADLERMRGGEHIAWHELAQALPATGVWLAPLGTHPAYLALPS